MANTIKVKRGTDANRTGITPAEGELLYTTDTKKVYVGDGTTAGGNEVGGGSQTPAELLADIKTVDGSGSGLDADLLDGNHASAFATAAQGALADSALQSESDTLDTVTGRGATTTNAVTVGKLTVDGDTIFSDDGYSIGNEYHTWKRDYSVSQSSPAELLYRDGNSLPSGGSYRFHAHIGITGTDNSATAVYWNQNGTWKVNVTYQSGSSSNHPEFIVDGNVPKIIIDHASTYTISVLGERLELAEGDGTDNIAGFGADAYMSVQTNVLRYNPTGGTGIEDGFIVWHQGNDGPGNGLDADLLDGQQGSYYQPASTALTTSTTFGGDVSGTYNAISVADPVMDKGDDISTQDWNTFIDGTEAYWHAVINHSGANRPVGSYNYGTALSFSTAGRNKLQIYTPEQDGASGGFYYRTGWNTAYRAWHRLFDDEHHPNADKWTTARTLTLNGDVSGSVSWDGSANATLSANIAANVVGANELNVSGNGTAGQVLQSDGDGSMTWATPSSGGITTGKAIAMAMVFG